MAIDYAKRKYWTHKSNAKHRGIVFKLTFEEWIDIWQQSGKWQQRGRGKGTYVMSRYNDQGAYEIGNVFIQSNISNLIDGNAGILKSEKHKQNMRKPKSFSLSRVTCVCCRKETTVNQIDRHFDNCKNKKAP